MRFSPIHNPITKSTCMLDTKWMQHLYHGIFSKIKKVWIWYYYGLGLFLVLQFLPLWNQTPKRKTLVAQGRVKFCDPLYVDWNWSQDLTLTLHRLSSPEIYAYIWWRVKYMHNWQNNAQGSLIYIIHEESIKYQIKINIMISV